MSDSTTSKGDASFYSAMGSSYEAAFGHDAGLLAFVREIASWLPADSHVLDAGCGTGRPVAGTLAAAGHRITGIDIAESMVTLSRAVVPAPRGRFEVADLRTYTPDFGDDGGDDDDDDNGNDGRRGGRRRFDAVLNIFSLFLFELEDFGPMPAKWNAWLEPGGLLAIATVAADDAEGGRWDEDRNYAVDVPCLFMGKQTAYTYFSEKGWRQMLGGAGFQIIHTSRASYSPPKEAQCEDYIHYYILARKL